MALGFSSEELGTKQEIRKSIQVIASEHKINPKFLLAKREDNPIPFCSRQLFSTSSFLKVQGNFLNGEISVERSNLFTKNQKVFY